MVRMIRGLLGGKVCQGRRSGLHLLVDAGQLRRDRVRLDRLTPAQPSPHRVDAKPDQREAVGDPVEAGVFALVPIGHSFPP